MRRIIYISVSVIFATSILVLLAFTNSRFQDEPYRSLEVEVLNPGPDAMITGKEIYDMIGSRMDSIRGKKIGSVDIHEIEKMITSNPFVIYAEVHNTIGGELIVKAMVRHPLIRVINIGDQQYYMDTFGVVMPVSDQHPARLQIASGYIFDSFLFDISGEVSIKSLSKDSVLPDIYRIAEYVSKDPFLWALIDQIYVNETLEFELIPKVGGQVILFGKGDHIVEKFDNLKAFYSQVMNQVGWNRYKTINIKFENQIVCSK
jgi:cell division protein FtsQ